GLETGVADGDTSGRKALRIAGEFQVGLIDRRVRNDVSEVRPAVGRSVRRAGLEIFADIPGEMKTRIVAIVGPRAERLALEADQAQLFDRANGSGLSATDTRAGGGVGIGTISVAQPDRVGIIEHAFTARRRFLETHAAQQAQTVAEKSRFALRIERRDAL